MALVGNIDPVTHETHETFLPVNTVPLNARPAHQTNFFRISQPLCRQALLSSRTSSSLPSNRDSVVHVSGTNNPVNE
jgi:hypothetical protein